MNKNLRHRLYEGTAAVLLSVIGIAILYSAGGSANAGAVTQSYETSSGVLPGMMVELNSKSQNTVEPLASQNIQQMLGVVVPINDAAIVLSSPSSAGQQVLVANSGHYELLVSSQNGSIK